jgi:hypothetical protein
VSGIAEHQVFHVHGPRMLHGTAGPDPAGLTDVSLSLVRRTTAGRCSYYAAARGRFKAGGCKVAARKAVFSIGASEAWSYLLPKALGPGSYRLAAVASDAAGRHTRVVRAFEVRP